MKRTMIAAFALTIVAASSACAAALTEQRVEGVESIKAIGCTVEETDIIAKGDGYKADDVECKDGQYDMMHDKDFKITGKEKED
jgi:muramoyltetrapeptide carboxypeptidase LdcA involved in peptidoglycan recycling